MSQILSVYKTSFHCGLQILEHANDWKLWLTNSVVYEHWDFYE